MATRNWLGGALVAACAALSFSIGLHAAESIADAAMRGDRADVLALIKHGADVNAPQGDGVTALHWASRHGDAEIVTALIAAGAHAREATRLGGYTPLHLAAERGSAPIVKALIGAGAVVDARTSTGATPLMLASAAGDTAAIKALLDKGADVNAKESDRFQTPLIFATANNRLEAVTLLVARGADPNAATKLTDLAALSRNGENPDGRNLAVKPETRKRAGPPKILVPGVERRNQRLGDKNPAILAKMAGGIRNVRYRSCGHPNIVVAAKQVHHCWRFGLPMI